MKSLSQKLIGLSAVLLLSAAGLPLRAAEPSAVGLWEQVDVKTGKRESLFRISEKNGQYEAVIVGIFFKPGDDPNFVCDKCQGDEKGRLLGLALIKSMQRNGLRYEGTILDPRDGSLFRGRMTLSPDGQKLEARPIGGVDEPWNSWPIWNRLPDDAATASVRPAPSGRAAPPTK
jgi:uncharacterized protein (DUF2147 family)